jgi:hypothetical protein
MKLTISTSKDSVSETAGSSYIAKSGLYPVTIDFVSVSISKNGAQSINFNITHDGNPQTLYGQTIVNTDGKPNDIGMKFLNKLGIVAGLSEGDELDIEEEEHPAGKDNKVQTFAVIQQFSGLEVLMHLQEEYSSYQGEIRKKMVIKAIFRADTATAEEIVNDSEIGKRYAETEAKYATNVTYLDNLTTDDVEAWKASKKAGGGKPATKPTASKAPTAGLFGKKTG